jgi:transposase
MSAIITITDQELDRVKLMADHLKGKVRQKVLAENWGVTIRQVQRLKKAYRQKGVEALIHGLRGKPSNHQIKVNLEEITNLIKREYWGYTPTFVFESLTQVDHHYQISDEKVRQIMIKEGLWLPKQAKRPIHHPLRVRRPYEAELVQLDGSPDYYLGREFGECCLIVFIDDATGKIFAYLCEVESTINYLRAMKPYFLKHGVPRAFYADRLSVFAPTPRKDKKFTNSTQFYRVCRELNIQLILANSPQAKGRVERANETLQGRLLQMFKYRRFTSFQEANDFLQNFYLDFLNAKFAITPAEPTNLSRPITKEVLDAVLVIKVERQLSKNLTCHYEGTTYQLFPNQNQSYLSLVAKQKVQVVTDLSNQIHFRVPTPNGLTKLRYQITKQLHITPVSSRKQVDIYLRKLAQGKPASTATKNPWETPRG